MAAAHRNWVFDSQYDLLRSYSAAPPAPNVPAPPGLQPTGHGDARQLRSVKVQAFVFNKAGQLLLLADDSIGWVLRWTAPSTVITLNDDEHQPIWKSVRLMMKQAIQEDMLTDLQCPDLVSGSNYVNEQWNTEDEHNHTTLQMNVIFTVGSYEMKEHMAINCTTKKPAAMKWLFFDEARKLERDDLPLPRLARIFTQLSRYAHCQNRILATIQAKTDTQAILAHVANLVLQALVIMLGNQAVYQGYKVSHALLLVKKDVKNSPLFVVEVPREIHDKITPQLQGQRVRSCVRIANWGSKATEFFVIGRTVDKQGDFRFQPGVTMAMLKGVLGAGTRLRMEWTPWNREVRLI
ncbi:uncharacterized protein RCC_03961 [Ramularia collo-cygni]|uniref:Uncharacterized protein n=1 Tax=Ramularia collo-cygni TaxID=112498 RepID=A0A2D3UQP2_9PEZI|nr:uncharacterized protein RCC_03961 [Ramularia collo-cygni]CZT18121.1 uncharacterized protein RCC_03961 [Ramularia collo-cygni]